jgi:hypothetical protein
MRWRLMLDQVASLTKLHPGTDYQRIAGFEGIPEPVILRIREHLRKGALRIGIASEQKNILLPTVLPSAG